jgi:hypothetical protein
MESQGVLAEMGQIRHSGYSQVDGHKRDAAGTSIGRHRS